MADGHLESTWSQLNYAKGALYLLVTKSSPPSGGLRKRTLSPVRLVLKVTLFLLLHCAGLFLCFWGVLTRLE